MTTSAPVTEDALRERLGDAQDLPFGESQIAAMEDVLRHAEAAGLERVAFDARLVSIMPYMFGGPCSRVFVPFARCLADHDANPAAYEPWVNQHLLQSYTQVMNAAISSPEISLAQVEGMLQDMSARYERAGAGLRLVYTYRCLVAVHVGDEDAARHWYDQWLSAPPDTEYGCVPCEPTDQAAYLIWLGREAEAIEVAAPVLDGSLVCSEQPQSILTALMVPYARAGEHELAMRAHRRAYRVLGGPAGSMSNIRGAEYYSTGPVALRGLADHVEFCARTGNEVRGLELFDRHIGQLDRPPSAEAEMRFAASAALLLRRVAAADAGVRVLRPAHGDRSAVEHPAGELAEILGAQALRMAARFDERNGTTNQSDLVRGIIEAEPVAEHIPLSVAAVRPAAPVSAEPELAELKLAEKSVLELVELAEQRLERMDLAVARAATAKAKEREEEAGTVLKGRIAFLRGRTGVLGELENAASLFEEGGDEARRQRALARLGEVYLDEGNLTEGIGLIRAALDYFERAGETGYERKLILRLVIAQSRLTLPEVDTSTSEVDTSTLPDVATLLARAEELTESADEELAPGDLAWARGIALTRGGESADDLDPAIEATTIALREYEKHDAGAMIVMAANRLASLLLDKEQSEEALNVTDTGVARLAAGIDPPLAASLLSARADALVRLDRAAEAVPVLRECVGFTLAGGVQPQIAHAKRSLAVAFRASGSPQDAVDLAEESLAVYLQLGDQHGANGVRYLLVNLHRDLNAPDAALAGYDELATIYRAEGRPGAVAQIRAESADVLDRLDRDALAAQHFHEAGTAAREAGDLYFESFCRYQEALSLFWSGDSETAMSTLESARALVDALPSDNPAAKAHYGAELANNESRMRRAMGSLPEAIAAAERAVALFTESGEVRRAISGQMALGDLLLQAERPADAERVLRAAIDEVVSVGGDPSGIQPTLATALEAQGRTDEAAALREATQSND